MRPLLQTSLMRFTMTFFMPVSYVGMRGPLPAPANFN